MKKYRNKNVTEKTIKRGDVLWTAATSLENFNHQYHLVCIKIVSDVQQYNLGGGRFPDIFTNVVYFEMDEKYSHLNTILFASSSLVNINMIFLNDTLETSIAGIPLFYTPQAAKRALSKQMAKNANIKWYNT